MLLFTYRNSIEIWQRSGLLSREIALYQKLQINNHKFSFVTFGNNEDLKYKKQLKNINIIPVSNLLKSRNKKIRFLRSLLIPLILKGQFKNVDIIKTNQLRGSWIACVAKLLYRKKIIIRGGYEYFRDFVENHSIFGKGNYLIYTLKYLKVYLLEFIAYQLADAIVLSSDSDIEFIIGKFKLRRKINRIFHFFNYIDTDRFKPMDIEKKDKHVLYIGRLFNRKNVTNLVMAFKHLKDFTLDIIGKGSSRQELEDLTKKYHINVNFLGSFPNNSLPKIINQYQIFILPSYYEGNPKVLLEAMSCGLACIGTNVRGINNILKHNQNGFLCELDSGSIKNAILDLYNNIKLRDKIGKNARDFIINNCSLTAISKKENLLYKRIFKK